MHAFDQWNLITKEKQKILILGAYIFPTRKSFPINFDPFWVIWRQANPNNWAIRRSDTVSKSVIGTDFWMKKANKLLTSIPSRYSQNFLKMKTKRIRKYGVSVFQCSQKTNLLSFWSSLSNARKWPCQGICAIS